VGVTAVYVRVNSGSWVVASGTTSWSSPVTLVSGSNTIYAYSQDAAGNPSSTSSRTVTYAPSSVATLSSLALSTGTLTPAFAATTMSYTVNVPNITTSITVTPFVTEGNATVNVNTMTVASGSASGAITLVVGSNSLSTVVTAQDGITKQTYTITVIRATAPEIAVTGNSTNISDGSTTPNTADGTDFGSVAITGGTLTRTFTIQNTGTASLTLGTVTLGGTNAADFSVTSQPPASVALGTSATFQVRFDPSASGTRSATLSFNNNDGDENPFNFSIRGTGVLSSNANLSNLVINTATLSPSFANTTTSYTASVAYLTTGVTVTPTVADATATVKVNNVAVTSGTASGTITLAVGSNTITTVVTAQDGSSKTYTVSITRPALAAVFNAASDVPVTASSYTATGNAVNLTLNYAPTTGTTLMIVKSTGLSFINGTFSNLVQGQEVLLTYAGNSYSFMANYFGGTGNDLVLLWADTKLLAWGYNANGQLGNSSTTKSTAPAAVSTAGPLAGKTVISASTGWKYSVVLCSDGTVVGTGLNGRNSAAQTTVPVAINSGALSGKTVVEVSAGAEHCLALCSDGSVAAWGYNGDGQLGNNSNTDSLVPVLVNAASGVSSLYGKKVVAVSAGGYHSLALCSDGTLAAWGYNGKGELGNNGTAASKVPLALNTTSGVSALYGKTVIAISGGVLALCSDSTIAAWGGNDKGELGNNSTTGSKVPVAVNKTQGVSALFGKTVVAAVAGGYHRLALCSDGTIAAWGNNTQGQFGNNSTASSLVPLTVPTVGTALERRTVTAVSAGNNFSFAQCSDGTLTVWGYNFYGQLGTNSTVSQLVPVAVSTSGLVTGERFLSSMSSVPSSHSLGSVAIPQVPFVAITNPVDDGATVMSSILPVNGNASDIAGVTAVYVRVNAGTWVTVSGTASWSSSVSLVPGSNTIDAYSKNLAGNSSGISSRQINYWPPSSNANLASLAMSAAALSPSFVSSTTNYTTSVANATSTVTVTPILADATATVKVNTIAVISGSASGTIPLEVGSNTITTVVTAQDGTTKFYTIIVTRTAPPAPEIAVTGNGINITTGDSSPSSADNTDFGSVEVTGGTVTRTFTITNSGTAMLNLISPVPPNFVELMAPSGFSVTTQATSPVASGGGTTTFSITFDPSRVGLNMAIVSITNNDGDETPFNFGIQGTGALSSNANLVNLVANTAALSPSFASSTTAYVAGVWNETTSVTITPTVAFATATVKVNNVTVTSGSASGPIALVAGSNTITTVVTAEDGSTKTYTVTVVKPGILALANTTFTVTSGPVATTADIVIHRTGGSGGTVGGLLSTSSGIAISPAQFTAQTNAPFSLANAQTVQHVLIPIAANATTTTAKTFTVTLSDANGGADLGSPLSAMVIILPPSASADITKPTVTITTPANNSSLNDNTPVIITGIAKDNIAVSKVEVSLDNGISFNEAVLTAPETGSTNYSFAMTPVTGLNAIQVRSIDFKGNISTVIAASFTQLRTLTVAVNGPANSGTATAGFAPTSSRQVGKSYSITATPKTGFVFNGWTANDFTGTGISIVAAELPVLTFTMQENLALTAKFIYNPFTTALVGTFNGLALPDLNTTPGVANVGLLSNLVLGTTGSFTGSLKIDGVSLSTPGFFDNNGVARFSVTTRTKTLLLKRTGKPDIELALNLNMTPGSGKLTGTVTQKIGAAVQAVSNTDADRAHYSTTNKVPVNLAGITTKPYTLVFPSKIQTPAQGLNTYPKGDGYATMLVNVNGTVSITGKLADHTPITASAPLSQFKTWPIFAQLYTLKGSIAGMAALTEADNVTEDVIGTNLQWFRPIQSVQWYPNGWPAGISVDVYGARYVVPPALPLASVFPLTTATDADGNATLALTGGLLNPLPLPYNINISSANLMTNAPVAASPTMLIDKATGKITGTFTHTDLTKPAYQGVIIQKGSQQGGRGYFMSRATPLTYFGESGRVQVQAK
jgi:uncharacterized repeat protein (TIGR02543 family)